MSTSREALLKHLVELFKREIREQRLEAWYEKQADNLADIKNVHNLPVQKKLDEIVGNDFDLDVLTQKISFKDDRGNFSFRNKAFLLDINIAGDIQIVKCYQQSTYGIPLKEDSDSSWYEDYYRDYNILKGLFNTPQSLLLLAHALSMREGYILFRNYKDSCSDLKNRVIQVIVDTYTEEEYKLALEYFKVARNLSYIRSGNIFSGTLDFTIKNYKEIFNLFKVHETKKGVYIEPQEEGISPFETDKISIIKIYNMFKSYRIMGKAGYNNKDKYIVVKDVATKIRYITTVPKFIERVVEEKSLCSFLYNKDVEDEAS